MAGTTNQFAVRMRISGMERMVSLFELADKSTFVHELGHVALVDLKMLAKMEGAPAQLVRDWQTVKEWLGYKDSQGFTREQHEKFIIGFKHITFYYFFLKNKTQLFLAE